MIRRCPSGLCLVACSLQGHPDHEMTICGLEVVCERRAGCVQAPGVPDASWTEEQSC